MSRPRRSANAPRDKPATRRSRSRDVVADGWGTDQDFTSTAPPLALSGVLTKGANDLTNSTTAIVTQGTGVPPTVTATELQYAAGNFLFTTPTSHIIPVRG